MLQMYLTLASRYLMGRKLRTLLTTLAIVFGVTILFGMNAIMPAMGQALRQNMLAATGQVDLTITDATDGTFSENIVDKVRNVEGIAAATGLLRLNAQLPRGHVVALLNVTGVDAESVTETRVYRIEAGRFIEAGDKQAIVIAESLAQQAELQVGDSITLPASIGTMKFEIVGILQSSGLPGNEEVFIPLEDAQEMFNQGERINTIEAIYAAGAVNAEMEAAVREALGDQYKLGLIDTSRTLQQNLELGTVVLNLFGVVALMMGGFIIFITFRTILIERRRDIGMLRAIGASRRTIIGTILAESILQGTLGTLIGLVSGYGLALGFFTMMAPIYEQFLHLNTIQPVFTPQSYVMAIGMGIGITVVAGLLPAFSAAQITPLDALRPLVAEVYDKSAGRSAVVGLIMLVGSAFCLISNNFGLISLGFLLFILGLILIIPIIIKPLAALFGRLLALAFAREGQIAQGNMTRQPNRAAVTVTVMMIGLAMLVALIGMITSVEEGFMRFLDTSLGVDYVLMPQSMLLSAGNVGANPNLAENIERIEGVETVTTIRMSSSLVGENSIQVVGIEPETYSEIAGLEFAEGEPEAVFAYLNEGRAAVINGILASTGIEVGDVLTLKTPEGDQEYTVVGIGTDNLNAKLSTLYISQENLAADFHQTSDLLILVEPEANANRSAVGHEIDALIRDYPTFTLFSFQEFRATQEATFKQSIGMMWVLAMVLAIPSLIALMNTQAINVMERTREIGMIRAVGATKRQIRRIILAETLLLAATGTAFGILGGLWLSYVMIGGMNSAGFTLEFYFPWAGSLAALALGLLVGVVAAIIPANQAAKLEIVQALRYE